jgi:hypothetical protein
MSALAPVCPTVSEVMLRHKVLLTILQEHRLRIIVVTPASPNIPASSLVHGYQFINPLLKEWTNYNIHWGLTVQAYPNQSETYIQVDVSTHPEGSQERAQLDLRLPIYVLRFDGGTGWEFTTGFRQ